MSAPLQIHPLRLARAGGGIERNLPMAGMTRLAGLLREPPGAVHAACRFSTGADERPVLELDVEGELVVTCQRCLERCVLEIRQHTRLVLVDRDADAAALPSDQEPLLVEGDTLDLAELVEDELILSVPSFPLHPAGDCVPPGSGAAEEGDPPSPFAVLATLLRDDRG